MNSQKRHPQSLANILGNQASPLRNILDRTAWLRRLNHLFQQLLEEPLNQHCMLANINKNQLVIHAKSSAWATRLTYQQAVLISKLKQHKEFSNIETIVVKVRPDCQIQANHDIST
jgi:hypothetical protein